MIETAAIISPIIKTNLNVCKDVVDDMFYGFLCEARSKYSLEKAIYRMISLTEKERLEFGVNGRKKATNEFSSKIVNKIYLDKINQIIKLT